MQVQQGSYTLTDDSARVNIEVVSALLSRTYWAAKRNIQTIEKSIENSVCFSLFEEAKQIGFARVVTDYATVAYIADVIIEESYRGTGLGKWLIEIIVNDRRWKGRLLLLATNDAHDFYQKYGFQRSPKLMGTI